MQYAGIVPNTKTNFRHQSFLYSIPPQFLSQIKIGSLVQIPFHGRKLEGIVVDFHKSQQGIEKEKIKTIANILERSVIDETHLKLSKWMSEYYLAPLSLCLFEMVALPLKKNVRIAENQPVDLKTFTNSFSSLKDLCQKVIDKEKQVIILFPYIKQAEEAFLILQKNFKKIALYHGGLSKSKRYFNFLKIKNNQIDIVIGSHLGIFAPLPRLGLTIIYNEEDDGYKNDRAPRYNVKSVAEKLRDITFSKLLLVSQTPSIESYFHFHQNKQQNIFLIKPKLQNEIKTVVVDMQNEYKNRRFSPLSQPLQRLLITNYKKGKKSILFVSRRGAASYIFCRLCGFTLSCPNCNLPLTYNIALDKEHSYFCHHCLFKTKPASSCPNCGSLDLKYSGIGTQKIEAEVKKILLKPAILRIDQDVKNIQMDNDADIIIGTQKILNLVREKADLVSVISADNILNIPDFRQSEKFFSVISKLKSLSENLFLVQTQNSQNPILKNIIKSDYQSFYKNELSIRKKLCYPPFCRLIKLLCQSKNEDKCQKEAKEIAAHLENIVAILGPAPCFYSKLRNKTRWQIVIKLPENKHLPQKVVKLIETLPKNWLVDVDPESLL